jgi:hypothetical protein
MESKKSDDNWRVRSLCINKALASVALRYSPCATHIT